MTSQAQPHSIGPSLNPLWRQCSACGGTGSVQQLDWSSFSGWLTQRSYELPTELFEAEAEFEQSEAWEVTSCPDCRGKGKAFVGIGQWLLLRSGGLR